MKFSRRNFLRGMLGGTVATVALPTLEVMLNSNGTAYSGGSPIPRRFVAFHAGNGYLLNRFVPATEGPDYVLTQQLAPLANVKQFCHVLTGLENKHAFKITHHEGMAGMWSGHPFEHLGGLNSKFGGPSIDQVIASRLEGTTIFPSLELGCSKRVSTDEGPTMQFMSHKGTEQPMPPTYSPRAVFQRIFSAPPPDDPSRPSRLDVLDAVLEDARQLKSRVGAADKLRLDAHLESVSRIQTQVAALPPVCVVPAMPTQENIDSGGREPMEAVHQAMTELLVHALVCNLTHVASYMLSPGVGHSVYPGQIEEQHLLSHDPVGSATELNESIVWNVQQFAHLLERMQATTDGAATLLDNSVVLLGSDCSEGWSHAIDQMPVIVAGGGGGRLRPGGHRRMPNRNLSDVLLTCAQVVCGSSGPTGITQVGSAEMLSTTPVSEILS